MIDCWYVSFCEELQEGHKKIFPLTNLARSRSASNGSIANDRQMLSEQKHVVADG